MASRSSTTQVFVDLDGVLADFYQGCFNLTGRIIDQFTEDDALWDAIRAHGNFYYELPVMHDAMELWGGLKSHLPRVLTGIPYSIPNVSTQKRLWVQECIDRHATVITCRSRDKYLHGEPGDILIDDRLKYSKYWVNMGGIFVHHTSARDTLEQLDRLRYVGKL